MEHIKRNKNYQVAVNIVTWNSEEYIEDLLISLEAQSFQDFYIIAIDNGSKDRTEEILKKYPRIIKIKNTSNFGFAKAHNKGIDMALKLFEGGQLDERYIFVVNPDIILEKNCLEKMLLSIYNNKNTAVLGAKLLRVYDEEIDNLSQKTYSEIIDSLGLEMLKSKKTIDISSGEEDNGEGGIQDVFGISGAFMCLRASPLLNIKHGKEYFDEDFFAYKEDVDLCWRFKNLGWDIKIDKSALAYHHRKIKGKAKINFWERHKNKQSQPSRIRYLSIRNHIWMICKNIQLNNFCVHLPFIFIEEAGKFIYTLFFDIKNIKAYFSAIKGISRMLKKRKFLKNTRNHC